MFARALGQLEATLTCFAVTALILLLTIVIFVKLTGYDDWEEIRKGNLAAAMALGGKIFGVANIMRFAVLSNSNPLDTAFWGAAGILFLMLVYQVFEVFFDRQVLHLDADREIAAGNRAVGFLSLTLSVAFSYVIGASIS